MVLRIIIIFIECLSFFLPFYFSPFFHFPTQHLEIYECCKQVAVVTGTFQDTIPLNTVKTIFYLHIILMEYLCVFQLE